MREAGCLKCRPDFEKGSEEPTIEGWYLSMLSTQQLLMRYLDLGSQKSSQEPRVLGAFETLAMSQQALLGTLHSSESAKSAFDFSGSQALSNAWT